MTVERQHGDVQDQERPSAGPGENAFALGFVVFIGIIYAVAGFAVWGAWHALIAR